VVATTVGVIPSAFAVGAAVSWVLVAFVVKMAVTPESFRR
jgi:hypothetical protein